MKIVELNRGDTLSIPGIGTESLEYLRRDDNKITLRNGSVLSFLGQSAKETYLLIGAEGDVNSILKDLKISN